MTKLSKKKARDVLALLQQALAFQNSGQLPEAEVRYRQVLADDPNNPDALHLLGLLAAQVGKQEEAVKLIGRAIAVKPHFHQAHRNIGILYLDLAHFDEALKHFLAAQRMRADDAELHVYMADALKGCGKDEEAIAAYQQALRLGVKQASEVHAQIGRLHLNGGKIQLACDAFLQAWQLDHTNADALYGVALADAKRLDDEHIRAVTDLLREGNLDEDKIRTLNFALGNYYNSHGEYDKAFQHYQAGNALRRYNYDVGRMAGEVDQLIRIFNRDLLSRSPLHGSASSQPIFVLGLPRSGTTLVEQILASHSQVYGAGEISALGEAIDRHMQARGLAYPAGMAAIDDAILGDIARDYLKALDKISDHAPKVVDKRPGNVAHIGLIRLAFPNAKIVLCQRDLRDVAISNYFLDFGARQPWTHDLAAIGGYIAHYRRLVDHWREVCGDALYLLHYESLVQDIEPQIRQLLAACGLAWEPQCLNFHEKPGAVSTASVSQVRKPVYTSSIGRWKHYAGHLGPFFASSGLDADEGRFWY